MATHRAASARLPRAPCAARALSGAAPVHAAPAHTACARRTYNALDARLAPQPSLPLTLARNAGLGFCASAVADTITNSLRVVKTFRQTSELPISYSDAIRAVVKADGWRGLFGRGLATRLLANGVQAALFSATWKYLEKRLQQHRDG